PTACPTACGTRCSRAICRSCGGRPRGSRRRSNVTADLRVTVAGLPLKNPVMAGSGEATMTLDGIVAALDAGAAAVVAKSTNESAEAKRQLEDAAYALLDERWAPLEMDAGRRGGPAPRGASLFNRS